MAATGAVGFFFFFFIALRPSENSFVSKHQEFREPEALALGSGGGMEDALATGPLSRRLWRACGDHALGDVCPGDDGSPVRVLCCLPCVRREVAESGICDGAEPTLRSRLARRLANIEATATPPMQDGIDDI